jgi:hypothetical protein
LLSGDEEFPGKYRTISHQAVLRGGLRLHPLVDIDLVVPFFHIRNRAAGLPDRTLFGQGDMLLISDWHPWRASQPDSADRMFSLGGLAFRGGFKLPTGRPERDLNLSQGPATLLQLGTGTLDFVGGAGFTGSAHGWTIFARASLQVPLHENRYGFTPGITVSTATGFSYTFFHMLTPGLALSTLHLGKDFVDDEPHPDTGSHFWFLTPSLALQIVPGIGLHASVRIPFIRRSKNPSTGDLFSIGVNWSIEF